MISKYAEMLYKTTNGEVGTTAHMIQKSGPFGRTCGFSNHLAKAGNFNNNGLNTICEGDRYTGTWTTAKTGWPKTTECI